MLTFNELFEEIQKHLECTYQNWFFGAGISFNANIPLMLPLTSKIKADVLNGSYKDLYLCIEDQLPDDAHIEHVLSHIGDLLAFLYRSKTGKIKIDTMDIQIEDLEKLYKIIVTEIGNLIRYGYKEATPTEPECVGTINNPIVEIEYHKKFVKKLFNSRANLENRSTLNFFTINYDTLLEDALILEKRAIIDGYTGSSMGFWNPKEFENKSNKFKVIKLHGSVDWYKESESSLIRCRYGTKYLSDNSNLLIYPQATKYIETQKDPFATLFNQFRSSLSADQDSILISCGYSFGDEHINNEIELALNTNATNKHAVFFVKEKHDTAKNTHALNSTLIKWLNAELIKDKIFVISNRGLYNSSDSIIRDKPDDTDYDWWTFSGLINFIS